MASVRSMALARALVQPMSPHMMSARPDLIASIVADHAMTAGFTPRPRWPAIATIISASLPMICPSLIPVTGMVPLIAMVMKPLSTVLNLGAAACARAPRKEAASAPAPIPAVRRSRLLRDISIMIFGLDMAVLPELMLIHDDE